MCIRDSPYTHRVTQIGIPYLLMLFNRASSVYVIPVDHTYIGCFEDKQGDRDMFLVPKVRPK